jgi:hypothetical protein
LLGVVDDFLLGVVDFLLGVVDDFLLEVVDDFLPVRCSISMVTASQWRPSAPPDRRAQAHASQYASLPNSFSSSVASCAATSCRARGRTHPRHPADRLDRPSIDENSSSTLSTRTDIGHTRYAFDQWVSLQILLNRSCRSRQLYFPPGRRR